MRLLTIGSDRNLFDEDSAVSKRVRAYASRFEKIDIIVFSRRSHGKSKVSFGNVSVYPTHSYSRFLYGLDARKIARTLEKPDVVDTQDPFEAGLVGLWLSRKYKVSLHVQIHTDLTSTYFKSVGLNRIRIAIARKVLAQAARVRVVSGKIKEGILKEFSVTASISVLPIFVDVQRFANTQIPSELVSRFLQFKNKLLVVSRLEPEKNPCAALRAFAASASKDACLILLGEGSERELLQNLARKLGVETRVFFEGYKDPAVYYKLADLVLVTSKYEGYGMTIVEALATGTPVLSVDVGVAKEAGAIIAPQEQFAAALKNWFANGEKKGLLKDYPYKTEEEYMEAYAQDIKKTAENN